MVLVIHCSLSLLPGRLLHRIFDWRSCIDSQDASWRQSSSLDRRSWGAVQKVSRMSCNAVTWRSFISFVLFQHHRNDSKLHHVALHVLESVAHSSSVQDCGSARHQQPENGLLVGLKCWAALSRFWLTFFRFDWQGGREDRGLPWNLSHPRSKGARSRLESAWVFDYQHRRVSSKRWSNLLRVRQRHDAAQLTCPVKKEPEFSELFAL